MAMRGATGFILLVAINNLIFGCTSQKSDMVWSNTVTNIDSAGLIPLFEIVRLADVAASKELKRVNENEGSLSESNGPFALEDYDKAIKQGYKGTRQFIAVSYRYRKPHGFFGHPAHFDVWVFRDNGELKFFGGH